MMILWNYILASNYPGAARVILLVCLWRQQTQTKRWVLSPKWIQETDTSFWQSSKRTPSHWVLHSIPVPKTHWKLSFLSASHNIVLVKNVSRRWLIFLFPSHSFCNAAGIPKEQQSQNEIWFWIKNLFRFRSFFISTSRLGEERLI